MLEVYFYFSQQHLVNCSTSSSLCSRETVTSYSAQPGQPSVNRHNEQQCNLGGKEKSCMTPDPMSAVFLASPCIWPRANETELRTDPKPLDLGQDVFSPFNLV